MHKAWLALIVSLWAASPLAGVAQTAPIWLDTFENRLEMLALTQTLNAEILASPSATLSLEKWCRDHKMAVRAADERPIGRHGPLWENHDDREATEP